MTFGPDAPIIKPTTMAQISRQADFHAAPHGSDVGRHGVAGVVAMLGLDPRRWAFAFFGIVFVGLAAAGVLLPGVPTTIFLILASWCFTRSCPVLERWLIRNRLFGPFLRALSGDEPMPRRAQAISFLFMWVAIGVSSAIIARGPAPDWIIAIVVVAGIAGSWFILRAGRPRQAN